MELFIKIKGLINNHGIRKYSINTSWLLADKIIRMSLGLFVGVWVARYLGPEKFGILSYVISFAALFAPLSKLGFDGIVKREIIRNEDEIDKIIGSAWVFKVFGSLLIVIIVTLSLYFIKENIVYVYLGLIISLRYVFQAFEVIRLYYEAKVKTKYVFIANTTGNLISYLLKVVFILSGATLIFFASANVVVPFLTMFILIYYFKNETINVTKKSLNIKKGFTILKESWPLIFSGLFAIMILDIDKIIIGEMLDDYNVGQYSAAVRISKVLYILPLTLRQSLLPAIVKAKKKDDNIYYQRIQLIATGIVFLAYCLILPAVIFSVDIIYLLYGSSYKVAGPLLGIHIFSAIFYFANVVRGIWITNESYFKFALITTIIGAIMNISLNIFLIPKFGVYGAAYATLVTYFFTYVGSNLLFKPAHKIFLIQLKALLFIDIIFRLLKKHE